MIQRLKTRWGVTSTRRFVVILVVFSLTGFAILFVKHPLFNLLGIEPDTTLWIKIPVVLIVYQILLILFGALLGEFRFFWEKEKKLGRLLIRPFRRT